MIKNMKQKISIFLVLTLGLFMTQLYQNCAPLSLDRGFAALSSTEGHDTGEGSGSHPPQVAEKIVPTRKQHIVNKTYVSEIFRDIFTSKTYPILNFEGMIFKWAYSKGPQFGGSCNFYSSYSGKDCTDSSANTNTPYFVDNNTVRESYRIQLCENILGINNGVKAGLEKLNLTVASPINAENVTLVYGLFYRDNPPDQNVLNALLDLNLSMANGNASPMDQWRAILSQVCESPGWQLF